MKPARARTWAAKFTDAARGTCRAVRSQRSFSIHLPVAVAAAAAGLWWRISGAEWAVVMAAIGLVLCTEILNSAIESLARGPGMRRHPRLRDALDMAAASVLVASLTAVGVGLTVFGPKLAAVIKVLGER